VPRLTPQGNESPVIPSSDSLFRGAHHPIAFQKATFRYSKFMKLYWETSKPQLIEASFVWDRYAPTLGLVHAYGCRTSSKRNESRKPNNRDTYCGAYQLTVRQMRSLAGTPGLTEVLGADVEHKIENGELAHVAAFITIRVPEDEEAIEGVKTIIVDRLWNSCRGPIKHICEVDRALDPHPNSNLEPAAQGPYVDGRSTVRRIFCLWRYRLLTIGWKIRMLCAPLYRRLLMRLQAC
jgi:hypothetical protein